MGESVPPVELQPQQCCAPELAGESVCGGQAHSKAVAMVGYGNRRLK